MIYWLCPYSEIPQGGIIKIIDHSITLNAAGYPSAVVFYDDNIFENRPVNIPPVNSLSYLNQEFTSVPFERAIEECDKDTVVVIPEIRPHLVDFFEPAAKKVIFVQNRYKIEPARYGLKKRDTYKSRGYDFAITCGDFLADYIQNKLPGIKGGNHSAGGIPVYAVNNSIDHSLFRPDQKSRQENRILVLYRKGPKHIDRLIKFAEKNELPVEFKVIDKAITQKELALEYCKSDIYVHTGYPEGLPLPPLEAMASGCAVIGFTGGGGLETMIDQETALVAPDGKDRQLQQIFRQVVTDGVLKEKIRKAGTAKALQYSRENEKKRLLNAFAAINESTD